MQPRPSFYRDRAAHTHLAAAFGPSASIARLVLVLALPLLLGCPFIEPYVDDPETDTQYELLRRVVEGGNGDFMEYMETLDAIESLETDLGGLSTLSLAERMAARQVPGVSIAVIDGGVVRWVEAFGVYDANTGAPMLRLSPLQGASLSKPTTAFAMLRLVEAGVIELDAPLGDSLESWTLPENELTAEEPVTLRRVLSHTAGINNSGFIGYPPPTTPPTLLELLDGLGSANNAPIRVTLEPGSVWRYSGGGYTILAQVVADLTGEPFEHFMETELLRRVGMWSSHFVQPSDDPRIAGVAMAGVFGNTAPPWTYPELPAAGLWTTALDMARFVIAIQHSLADGPYAQLTAESARLMITPQEPGPSFVDLGGPSPNPGMGLGLFLAGAPDPGWFWHTGSNLGFNCLIIGDTRGLGHGVVIMTNGWPGGNPLAWEIAQGVAAIYDWPGWDS